jgi:hypothetical protein
MSGTASRSRGRSGATSLAVLVRSHRTRIKRAKRLTDDALVLPAVSEFGMEAMPDMRTIDFWLNGDKSQAYPQSRVMANHNKADGYERRLALYMIENYSASRAIS